MAEGIAKDLIRKTYPELAREVKISSCGTSAYPGEPPTAEALLVMRERGIDISAHRARALGDVSIDSLMVAMEEGHLRRIAQTFEPSFKQSAVLLLKLAEAARVGRKRGKQIVGGSPLERLNSALEIYRELERNSDWESKEPYSVTDPMGMPKGVYEEVAKVLETAIGEIFSYISGTP